MSEQELNYKSIKLYTEDKINETLKGRIAALETTVNYLVELLDEKVDKKEIISQINVSEEGILIKSDKIHINGKTMIDDNSISDANIISLDGEKVLADTLSVISTRLGNVE